jgi:ketosteroid isomerase-like protein
MNSAASSPSDRAGIIDAAVAYATAVDTRDWALFASLFTPDAVWEYPAGHERRTGPDDIVARVRPSIEGLDATQHFVTNHVVTITGGTARHACYYLAQHLRGGERFLAAGRYADEFRRHEGGWRIAARVLISTWADGNPAVLRPRPGAATR